ncbi:MAG TPA: peptide chain release factor 2 [Planctomycetes bacterium]|nr:peptide chain release factor 2 [Planctomycetota bacterium]
MGSANFWDNQETAQQTVAELKRLGVSIDPVEAAAELCNEQRANIELGDEFGVDEVRDELARVNDKLRNCLDTLELQVMLGGEHDSRNAYITLQSGAGGVDATDFTEMLMRMYVRWAEANEFEIEEIELLSSDEGGIRHTTLLIRGPFVYGKLSAERGVHRLVRISPYDSQGRRHTSFAAVEVMPQLDEDAAIEIDMSDVRVDTYRAGGAGGQHVNKTDSAVRMTHQPSGIVVQCQNERSQLKNREIAKSMLASKLYELREREKNSELQEMYGSQGEISWGSQIRSYVLHPYQMVKDHRTNHEVGNAQSVLEGDINPFIEAYLRARFD